MNGAIRGQTWGRQVAQVLPEDTKAEARPAAVAALRKAPPAPGFPAVHGKDIVAFFVCYAARWNGGRLVAPIKRWSPAAASVTSALCAQQSLIDATQPKAADTGSPSTFRAIRPVLAGGSNRAPHHVSAFRHRPLPAQRRAQPASERPFARRQSGRGVRVEHHRLMGKGGG
jgi:hypothetical protein